MYCLSVCLHKASTTGQIFVVVLSFRSVHHNVVPHHTLDLHWSSNVSSISSDDSSVSSLESTQLSLQGVRLRLAAGTKHSITIFGRKTLPLGSPTAVSTLLLPAPAFHEALVNSYCLPSNRMYAFHLDKGQPGTRLTIGVLERCLQWRQLVCQPTQEVWRGRTV